MIRVLIAADSVVVRAGLEAIVSPSSALTVIGTATSRNLATQIAALQPDVVLLEWDFEDELTLLLPLLDDANCAIVLLVEELPARWIAESLRNQVRGVLPSEADAEEIIGAIEAAAAGLTVLHPVAVEALLPSLPAPSLPVPVLQTPLTPREIEVLGMLAAGLGNKSIARRLQISEHTVKFHVGSLFSKLNASSRTEAVMLGARQGLILL